MFTSNASSEPLVVEASTLLPPELLVNALDSGEFVEGSVDRFPAWAYTGSMHELLIEAGVRFERNDGLDDGWATHARVLDGCAEILGQLISFHGVSFYVRFRLRTKQPSTLDATEIGGTGRRRSSRFTAADQVAEDDWTFHTEFRLTGVPS